MKRKGERGFSIITLAVMAIVALAALKYFLNWDIFDAAESEQGQSTIEYLRNIINTVWGYIEKPVRVVWNDFAWPVLSIAWQSFQAFVDWARATANQGV